MEITLENSSEYLITWDLPLKPAGDRVRFHRRLKRLLKQHGLEDKKSKGSVIVVKSQKLANEILQLAKEFGDAHLYPIKKVRKLK